MAQEVTTQASPRNTWRDTAPLRYTSNPWLLFISDLKLFRDNILYLVWVLWPLKSHDSLDELSPSAANFFAVFVHFVLFFIQLAFLASVVCSLVWLVPLTVVVIYAAGFLVINYMLCKVLLNGNQATLLSNVDLSHFPNTHEDERWIFLNGVGVGKHWLQANVDRISLTFGRPVLGVHNPTCGIIFDILQCVIQRDFTYVSLDIRNCYAEVKKALANPRYKKVIFILHSQGGIEGGLILDWLLASVPSEITEKLEIYTFANAANHFNNPKRLQKAAANGTKTRESQARDERAFRYIEHYANTYDFVSRVGVLHFASQTNSAGARNRFMGRVFERAGTGHLLNQHYFDAMFPLDKKRGYGVLEHNSFVDSKVRMVESDGGEICSDNSQQTNWFDPGATKFAAVPDLKAAERDLNAVPRCQPSLISKETSLSTLTVAELSRLWAYRNGRVPLVL